MGSQHELPATAAMFNSSQKLVFSAGFYNVYNMTHETEYGLYLPSFWAGFVASPNFSLFIQMASGSMQRETIAAFGPVLNFVWGEEAKETALNIAVNHLKGPKDFRTKDISMSVLKKTSLKKNILIYGLSPHYINAKIDLRDRNLKKSINETIFHIRLGMYRNIQTLDLGFELDLSRETMITKLNMVMIL